MIEIIPNWHPVFVHFTIGLLVTAAVLFPVGVGLPGSAGAQATTVARWNLWIGTAFAVLTVAAGYQAYFTVGHDDPAHAAMLIHMKWAWAALVLFLVAALLAWRERTRTRGAGPLLAIFLAAGTGALLATGYLGAENVYRHGLGVMRLPAAEGPGHEHSHENSGRPDEGAGHSHADGGHSDEGAGHSHADGGHDTAAPALLMQTSAGALPEAAAAPAAVVDEFASALAGGDLERARQLLEPQVQIFESGNVERSAEEYASHHMHSDAAFLAGARVTPRARIGGAAGDLAWIASESTIEPAGGGVIASTETMVLRKTPAGWRIAHIHWSSRRLEPAARSSGH